MRQGRLGELTQALVAQAWTAAAMGDTTLGLTAATEAQCLTIETSQPLWALSADIIRGNVAALRGDGEIAQSLADRCERVLLSLGVHPMLAQVQQTRGVEALVGGRFEEAYDHLSRIYDPADIAHHPYTGFNLVEHLADSALRGGRDEQLAALTRQLGPIAERSGSPSLRAGLAYAEAVTAADDEAEGVFLAELEKRTAPWPFPRARLQLAYGAWLRRQRRAADSRPHLRAAISAFDALGVTPWAERARQELRASGETLRRPDDARHRLTPQEIQIAGMAAEGLSNREIAARLFLSPRTVGTHLYRIYPKVGVKTRAELARVLTAAAATS